MRALSPTSVLIYVEDELPNACLRVAGQKTKRPKATFDESDDDRSINLRHHLVCNDTVRWISKAGSRQRLEELRIGPLFESARTVFAMIDTLPSSVTHLDLDLRNVLHILPEVFSRLFQPNKRHLTSLSIRLFGDSGAVELAKWLHKNPNLRKLDLRDNRMGNMGLNALVTSISQCNHHLEELDLGCNCILDISSISDLLQSNIYLTKLDLSCNWIGDRDVAVLCHGLQPNASLRRLSLTGCQRITEQGVSLLIKCLRDHNASLQHIYVGNGDESNDELQAKLQHWLGLNRVGRGFLRSEDSAQSPLWPIIFSKNHAEPTMLYHMLKDGGNILFADAAGKIDDLPLHVHSPKLG